MSTHKLLFLPVSLYFTGILIMLLGVAVLNSLVLFNQIHILQADAKLINELGLIRGTIQRITKRELASAPAEDLIRKIDTLILKFNVATPEVQYMPHLHDLERRWQQLKTGLKTYRRNPSEANRQDILAVSEVCWQASDEMVFAAQVWSENKARSLYLALLFTGMHIVTLVTILCLNRTYVHNTLERLAHYDFLTKLLNRYSYNKILETEIMRAARYQHHLALIIADLDHFKDINDTYGHKVGDQILIQLAAIFREQVRQPDSVARIGGEEFAVITPETSREQACQLAERLRQCVAQAHFREIPGLTISLGVTELQAHERQDALFRRADQALYQAKMAGRNLVVAL
jgi:diguanylate cyclase (GGDEF)-like protein